MVVSKLPLTHEGNELKNLTDGNKGKASKPKNYRGKKPQNNPSPDPKSETNFKGRYNDLEGYILYLGPRVSEKFTRTMKKMEQYFGVTCSYICQTDIMTETTATFPDPDITKTIPDSGTERPKTDAYMTYLENKNINESIHQNLRKKYVYKSDMHKIYNLIIGQMNEQLQEKAASDDTFQAVKTD